MQQEPERQQPVTGDAGYKQTVQLYECVLADLTHLSLNLLYPVHHKIPASLLYPSCSSGLLVDIISSKKVSQVLQLDLRWHFYTPKTPVIFL